MPRESSSSMFAINNHASLPYARPDRSFVGAHPRSLSQAPPPWRPALLDYNLVPRESYQSPSDEAKHDTFLRKLWCYILDSERTSSRPVLYWSRSRRYLLIPDEARLVAEVAVVLFKQKDYSSFARQLNIYNFKRCSQSQIRELRAAEGIPEGCKVWVHPYLHGDSPLEELSKVKRHASSKRAKPTRATVSIPTCSPPMLDQVPTVNRPWSRSASPRPLSSSDGSSSSHRLAYGDIAVPSFSQAPNYRYGQFNASSSLPEEPHDQRHQHHRSVPLWSHEHEPTGAAAGSRFDWPLSRSVPASAGTTDSLSNASPSATSAPSVNTTERACASAQLDGGDLEYLDAGAGEDGAERHSCVMPAFRLEPLSASRSTSQQQHHHHHHQQPRSMPDRRTSLDHLVDAALTA